MSAGTVYLLHFDRLYVPYPGAPRRDCAGHYVGWTTNIKRRMAEHKAGRAAGRRHAATGHRQQGAVSKARRWALDAIRAPAVAEYRATVLAELDALSAGAWEDVRDPGPKTSVTGAVVKNPQTGEPL